MIRLIPFIDLSCDDSFDQLLATRRMSTKLLSIAGLILSIYAVWVEHKMETKDPDEEFSSLCDIEAIGASCR
jgi:hypothetical protein